MLIRVLPFGTQEGDAISLIREYVQLNSLIRCSEGNYTFYLTSPHIGIEGT